jgi:type II secretory pathway predicted ATPase ExeA
MIQPARVSTPEAAYWGLAREPFDRPLRPVPCAAHEEALARLEFLVERRRLCGIVLGPEACGKSALLRKFETQLRRCPVQVARLEAASALLWQVHAALGLAPTLESAPLALWQELSDSLRALRDAGDHAVLLIDHADRLQDCGLSVVGRLLRTWASSGAPVTIILAARAPLPERLHDEAASCADLRIELAPLERQETVDYVRGALLDAGGRRDLFDAAALAAVHERTGGRLGRIDRLCGLALLAAMADEHTTVTRDVIEAAAAELTT